MSFGGLDEIRGWKERGGEGCRTVVVELKVEVERFLRRRFGEDTSVKL